MSRYAELDSIVDAIAARGDVQIQTDDIHIDPEHTVPDTLLYATIPGAKLASDPTGPDYSHCIHRYTVIGGEDITWVGPGALGSTTRGPFGETPCGDDIIEDTWAEILARLSISPDPHTR